jgi:D-sedoheptulose 7-phosphate isomerase
VSEAPSHARISSLGRADWLAGLEARRAAGERIVSTNGCFDLLHAGHAVFLEQARAQGDVLVVGLNSDASVRRLKGPGRPVVDQEARACLLAGLRAVDLVVIFDEETPERFLEALRPHVHCKGADYTADALPEAAAVRRSGGRICILPLVAARSTSALLARIAAAPAAEGPQASAEDARRAADGAGGDERRALAEMLDAGRVVLEAARALAPAVAREAARVRATLASGGRVLICGNGGSAADAQHLAGELVGRFRYERAPMPAVALTADGVIVSALANDYGWASVFSRQVEALGRPGDLLFAISTSGRSENVIAAVATARARGLHTTGLVGGRGSPLELAVEHALVVPSNDTPLIQQAHRAVLHTICALVERPTADGRDGG